MKLTQNTSIKRNSGMTLIELTVVIVVLLALIAVLFVGAQAYKKGADKAACTMAQRNVQQACRAYYNLNPAAVKATAALLAAESLLAEIPTCPTSRLPLTFDGGSADQGIGVLFATCGIATHKPENSENW